MIGNLICKASVDFLRILIEQAKNHRLDVNKIVAIEFFPIEQVAESPEDLLVGEDHFEQAVDHRVAESEGSGGKLIEDGGICIRIVLALSVQI